MASVLSQLRGVLWPPSSSSSQQQPPPPPRDLESSGGALIVYGSQTGQAQSLAHALERKVLDAASSALPLVVASAAQIEPEELQQESQRLVVLIVSTYEEGSPPDNAKFLATWLRDAANDEV